MQFSLEVGGVDTVFPDFKFYNNKKESYILFNFCGLSPEDILIFEDAKDRRLLVKQEVGIIALYIPKYKKQFAAELPPEDHRYTEFFEGKIEICFSYIDGDKQREQIYCFHN